MPYYGSAQVGHLYFFGSVSQTQQRTVVMVPRLLSFSEKKKIRVYMRKE